MRSIAPSAVSRRDHPAPLHHRVRSDLNRGLMCIQRCMSLCSKSTCVEQCVLALGIVVKRARTVPLRSTLAGPRLPGRHRVWGPATVRDPVRAPRQTPHRDSLVLLPHCSPSVRLPGGRCRVVHRGLAEPAVWEHGHRPLDTVRPLLYRNHHLLHRHSPGTVNQKREPHSAWLRRGLGSSGAPLGTPGTVSGSLLFAPPPSSSVGPGGALSPYKWSLHGACKRALSGEERGTGRQGAGI